MHNVVRVQVRERAGHLQRDHDAARPAGRCPLEQRPQRAAVDKLGDDVQVVVQVAQPLQTVRDARMETVSLTA